MRHPLGFGCIAVVLCCSPAAHAASDHPWALWVEPVGSAVYGAAIRAVYVSGGLEVPGGRSWSWSFELAGGSFDDVATGTGEDAFATHELSFWFSTGPNFFFGPGREQHNGFFLHPKFLGTYTRHNGFTEEDAWDFHQVELHLGLDLGFRFAFGNFYVAPLLGVSAGACLPAPTGFSSRNATVFSPTSLGFDNHGQSFTVGLNLNLLRIGAAF